MWKNRLRSFVTFTRQERRGVIVLVLILALAWALPYLSVRTTKVSEAVGWRSLPTYDSSGSSSYLSMKRTHQGGRRQAEPRRPERAFRPPAEVAPFDPNTATEEEWLRMGLTARQASTIGNYLSKGGRFRRVEDLRRIYGFPEEAYAALSPFVRLPPTVRPNPRGPFTKGSPRDSGLRRQRRPPPSVGINSADSAVWESLPGIGPFLASRIVRFRDRLGGFHNVMQVAETFGLPDSVFRRIRPFLVEEPLPFTAGLDVNSATLEQLKAHPYMSHRLAVSVVAYRRQHGAYRKAEDLLAIETFTPELFEKLKPYLLIR